MSQTGSANRSQGQRSYRTGTERMKAFRSARNGRISRVAALMAALAGCTQHHSPVDSSHPAWLSTFIRQLESEPAANPPAYIAEYEYRGRAVYYLPPRCCDVPSRLYDREGAILCEPDGGLTGRGDGRCPGFFEERGNERVIWRGMRSA